MILNRECFIIFLALILNVSCSEPDQLIVESAICPKEISLEKMDTTDAQTRLFSLKHNGFCYYNIDSFIIEENRVLINNEILSSEKLIVPKKNFHLYDNKDNTYFVNFSKPTIIDSAYNIQTNIIAKYDNQSQSNKLSIEYKPLCSKYISMPTSEFLSIGTCETDAGTGDNYMIYFMHQGYCTQDIDSISGYADFYDEDGYYWNTSNFSVKKERINLIDTSFYNQAISFKVCITWSFNDLVDITMHAVYKDNTESNKLNFVINWQEENLNKKTNADAIRQLNSN